MVLDMENWLFSAAEKDLGVFSSECWSRSVARGKGSATIKSVKRATSKIAGGVEPSPSCVFSNSCPKVGQAPSKIQNHEQDNKGKKPDSSRKHTSASSQEIDYHSGNTAEKYKQIRAMQRQQALDAIERASLPVDKQELLKLLAPKTSVVFGVEICHNTIFSRKL